MFESMLRTVLAKAGDIDAANRELVLTLALTWYGAATDEQRAALTANADNILASLAEVVREGRDAAATIEAIYQNLSDSERERLDDAMTTVQAQREDMAALMAEVIETVGDTDVFPRTRTALGLDDAEGAAAAPSFSAS